MFNTGCLFKVEYDPQEQYSTFFDFEIMYSSVRRRGEEGEGKRAQKVVDKRRLYVNAVSTLHRFKRVLFDDVDYFSYSDVLFISQSFGEKVRLQ